MHLKQNLLVNLMVVDHLLKTEKEFKNLKQQKIQDISKNNYFR